MSTNQKQLYKMLLAQKTSLLNELNPETKTVTEIPADFNQKGWDLTIEAVERMLVNMKEARDNKGKRMTPQFFKAIFNRTVTANEDMEKMKRDLEISSQTDIDYASQNIVLNQEILELHNQLSQAKAEKA